MKRCGAVSSKWHILKCKHKVHSLQMNISRPQTLFWYFHITERIYRYNFSRCHIVYRFVHLVCTHHISIKSSELTPRLSIIVSYEEWNVDSLLHPNCHSKCDIRQKRVGAQSRNQNTRLEVRLRYGFMICVYWVNRILITTLVCVKIIGNVALHCGKGDPITAKYQVDCIKGILFRSEP